MKKTFCNSTKQNLLGIKLQRNRDFDGYVLSIYKNEGKKLAVLARLWVWNQNLWVQSQNESFWKHGNFFMKTWILSIFSGCFVQRG